MDELTKLLINAIKTKTPIRASYQGHERYLCIHGLGYKNRRDGSRSLQAIAYQYDGRTSNGPVKIGSGHKENWRCMEVAILDEVISLESEEWHTVDAHSSPNTCIDEYIAEVQY